MEQMNWVVEIKTNLGSKEEPDIVTSLLNKGGDYSETNYAIAKSEACNGVKEIPETAEGARAKRDKLLSDTDWTQTLDAPINEETKTAYRVYRQALRDVPQQEGFPETISWPELPEKVKAAPEPVDEAVDLLLSGATGEEASA